jgi:hypothetical protein
VKGRLLRVAVSRLQHKYTLSYTYTRATTSLAHTPARRRDTRQEVEFFELLRSDALTDLVVPRKGGYTLPYLVGRGCSIAWEFRVKVRPLAYSM